MTVLNAVVLWTTSMPRFLGTQIAQFCTAPPTQCGDVEIRAIR